MSGTKAGAAKTRKTMVEKLGGEKAYKDHFRKLGAAGGRGDNGRKHLAGFGDNPMLASMAGSLGGFNGHRAEIEKFVITADTITDEYSIICLIRRITTGLREIRRGGNEGKTMFFISTTEKNIKKISSRIQNMGINVVVKREKEW